MVVVLLLAVIPAVNESRSNDGGNCGGGVFPLLLFIALHRPYKEIKRISFFSHLCLFFIHINIA